MDICTPGDRERFPCGIRETGEKRTKLGRGGHRQACRAHLRRYQQAAERLELPTPGVQPDLM